jgi:hypothetical protein
MRDRPARPPSSPRRTASLPAWIAPASDLFGAGPASLSFTLPPNQDAPRSAVIVVGGQNVTIAQAGAMTIAGQITLAGSPLEGAGITLSGASEATTASDSGGYFSFENLDSTASYTITPALDGYVFTPANLTFSNVTANPVANFTAKAR